MAAATTPIGMLPTTQRTAAPKTSDRVIGRRLHHLRDHLLAAIDEGSQIAGDEEPLHHQRVLHRQRLIEAEARAHGGQHLRRGVAPGDARGGIGAGRGEEDQEDEDADAEHHEEHLGQAADEGVSISRQPIRSLARGSSASRTPSPSTLSASTVQHDGDAGRQRHQGRV